MQPALAMVKRRVPHALGAALLFLVVFAVLFGAVVSGRATFVHGDALSVSLPLQQVLAKSLARGEIPLWSDAIYGGHPVFAEGQGGFAHPLNWLLFGGLARLFDAPDEILGAGTLYAHGLLHVLCGWIAAFGTFGFCRALGRSPAASVLAALALATSQDWLAQSGNSAIALSCAFAPAVLWAVERWWQQPDAARATVLGLGLASMVLAGYPQALHAVAIFSLTTLALRVDGGWLRAPGRHLASGLLAVAVGLGLSAVQLLPTVELVGQSVRSGGVELVQTGTPLLQLRGLLFSVGQRGAVEPGLGSLTVLWLAGVGVGRQRPTLGLALATLLLLQLGLADASPVYRVLHGSLPGLASFRVTHLYGTIALVGVAALAAFGVDRLRDAGVADRGLLLQAGLVGGVLALAAGWLHDEHVGALAYAFPLAALALVVGLHLRRVARALPVALVVLLLVEIVALRRPLYEPIPVETVREPPATVAWLLDRHPRDRDFQIASVPHFFSYIGFATPSTPGLERLARLFLSSLDGGSNLIWGLPSLHANLALPLARRAAVSDLIVRELQGESPRAPGRRLVDALGVRYVVAHNQHRKRPYSAELQEVFYDDELRFRVLENPYARSRLQVVPQADAQDVPDFTAAVASLSRGGPEAPGLVVETSGETRKESAPGAAPPASGRGGEVVVAESTASRHTVVVEAHEPVYLLIADAPYPGWQARLDGEPVPVLAADVLAKAVAVPPGTHRVEVFFAPASVRRGAWISGASLLAVAILLGSHRGRVRRARRAPDRKAP